jgi:hypothetical protein
MSAVGDEAVVHESRVRVGDGLGPLLHGHLEDERSQVQGAQLGVRVDARHPLLCGLLRAATGGVVDDDVGALRPYHRVDLEVVIRVAGGHPPDLRVAGVHVNDAGAGLVRRLRLLGLLLGRLRQVGVRLFALDPAGDGAGDDERRQTLSHPLHPLVGVPVVPDVVGGFHGLSPPEDAGSGGPSKKTGQPLPCLLTGK